MPTGRARPGVADLLCTVLGRAPVLYPRTSGLCSLSPQSPLGASTPGAPGAFHKLFKNAHLARRLYGLLLCFKWLEAPGIEQALLSPPLFPTLFHIPGCLVSVSRQHPDRGLRLTLLTPLACSVERLTGLKTPFLKLSSSPPLSSPSSSSSSSSLAPSPLFCF